jgi:MFS family permease
LLLGCPKTFDAITKKLTSTPKQAAVATFMVANAFVWYLSAVTYLEPLSSDLKSVSSDMLFLIGANLASLMVSAFAVASLTNKLPDKLKILKMWVLAGVLISPLFLLKDSNNTMSILFLQIILGVYFGVGMPLCMNFYAKSTQLQNRAKLSGVVILLIGVGLPLIGVLGGANLILFAVALAVWRAIALILILPLKSSNNQPETTKRVTFQNVISNKPFLLYVFPWLMFSLINELTRTMNTSYLNVIAVGGSFQTIENVVAGASAILCGIYADKKGRKRLALAGFALLGLGYASIGLFVGNAFAAWFFVFVDGAAWGAFSMLFLVTIWGDIAQNNNSEKYYFLGVLPYLFSNLAGVWAGPFISNIDKTPVFSFASIFLFIAILPLMYAPETLPDKILKNLDLSNYINKAIEKAKKTSGEQTDESDAFKKARATAEKYY